MTLYGDKMLSKYGSAGVIQIDETSTSQTGNIVFRVGNLTRDRQFTQAEHVVLTPDEARGLAADLARLVARESDR